MKRALGIALATLTACTPDPSDAKARLPAKPTRVIPPAVDTAPLRTDLVSIPSGEFRPFLPGKDEPKELTVDSFRLETHPVTNDQFLRFVLAKPRWRRSAVKRLFADGNYLAHWVGDCEIATGTADQPVTNISWFAAREYAAWIGRRLPTLEEWEYVAAASEQLADGRQEPGHSQRILDWYGQTSSMAPNPVRLSAANFYGVHDMHGLVWEWVENFNTALVTGESRGGTGLERRFFCGAGSIGSADPTDYASFMRFAFRSSLQASYTIKNLGFRCAASPDK